MPKIPIKTPIAEMNGDEMTRIIWQMIKDELLEPYIDLKTELYDLSLTNRDATDDAVTIDAADAVKRLGVGVKCATITPNAQRVEEYSLKKMWKSPNGTIRARLDGTTFREPITVNCIKPSVRTWKKPIAIARHTFGDVYSASEYLVTGPGKAELVFTGSGGEEQRQTIHTFAGAGILQGMFNVDASIEHFARACFVYALDKKQDLWFSTKDTISKIYDHHFKDIFQAVYESEFAARFKAAGISYFYTLIDDAVARVIRSEGGFVWACKNYDGDVMSDMVATAFGSLAMMTSVLVSPNGQFVYEAAHGTVTRHYYQHREGKETSTNAMATLFAWTGALKKRGELDGNPVLHDFALGLEHAAIRTIESGTMTKDLVALADIDARAVNTLAFIQAIRSRIKN